MNSMTKAKTNYYHRYYATEMSQKHCLEFVRLIEENEVARKYDLYVLAKDIAKTYSDFFNVMMALYGKRKIEEVAEFTEDAISFSTKNLT